MKIARKEYGSNIEVRNIAITGGGSGLEAAYIGGSAAVGLVTGVIMNSDYLGKDNDHFLYSLPFIGGLNLLGHFQKITATGDVVSVGGTGSNIRRISGNQSAVETAMNNAAEVIMDSLQRDLKLAIVNVSSADRDLLLLQFAELLPHWLKLEYWIIENIQAMVKVFWK